MKIARIATDGSLALIGRLFKETGRDFAARYVLVLIFGLGVAGTTAFGAWLVKDVVNLVFVEQRTNLVYLLSAVFIANGIARGAFLYGSTVTLGHIGNAIVARAQLRMYDHLLDLGMDFFNRTQSSDLLTRMSHNAAAAREVLDTIFTRTGRDLLTLIGLFAVMFVQNPIMSLLVLLIGPITVAVFNRLVKRVRAVARAQFSSLTMVISDMQQTAGGIRIIKAFNLESIIRRRMATSIDLVRQRSDKIVQIRARASPVMEILGATAIGLVVLWAGYRSTQFDEPPGALLSFMAALVLTYEPAKRLASMQIPLEAGLVGVRLMYELLDTEPTMDVNPDGPDLTVSSGEIVFDKVDFAYPDRPSLFASFDFRAAGGKTTALVGPSGAGKSTLIALIERYYDIDGGRIRIDGQDIAAVKLASLRRNLALVTQDTVLFHDTVRENIRFGRPDANDAEVEQAARDAVAHDFIMATAEGYDTVLGDGATLLSGGQRQRIAIARAMLRNPRILLLDEAMAALDSESEHQVQVALDRLMKGRTTIVIAHRLSTVHNADTIAVLVDGRIVEEGRHDALIALGKHYARLYRLQFERHERKTGDKAASALTVSAT